MKKGDSTQCLFQLSCQTCYEVIGVIQEFIAVDISGKPIDSELIKIFKKPELNAEKCPCCDQTDLVKHYAFESTKKIVIDDLPF